MNIAGNEAIRAALLVYSDYSKNPNRLGGLDVSVAVGGAETRLVESVPTVFSRQIVVAARITGIILPATLIVRKYFMARNLYVDETFNLANAISTVFVSLVPLEEVEILIKNNDAGPAPAATAYATVIVRH